MDSMGVSIHALCTDVDGWRGIAAKRDILGIRPKMEHLTGQTPVAPAVGEHAFQIAQPKVGRGKERQRISPAASRSGTRTRTTT